MCASVIAVIATMMYYIRLALSDGHVHGGKSNNDFGPLNPHLTFEHKFENGHLIVGRYKKALTMKGMDKSGDAIPNLMEAYKEAHAAAVKAACEVLSAG